MPINVSGSILNSSSVTTLSSREIVTRGLKLYVEASAMDSYPQSGTAIYDLSGNGNTGTLNNSTGFSTSSGGYMTFNGSNQSITFSSLGTLYTQGTIMFWVYPSVVSNYNNPVSTHNSGNIGFRWEESTTGPGGSGTFGVVTGNDSGTYTGFSYFASGFTASQWYHIAFSWDTSANMVYGYTNAVSAFSSSNTLWPSALSAPTMGCGFTSRYWNGYLGNMIIYNRILTSTEVTQNFTFQRGRFGI